MQVASLWRFPCKSMLGQSVGEVRLTERGVVGDRAYALVDPDDGKVVSAKNPRKWGRVLELAAAFVDEPTPGDAPPPITVTFPDGEAVRSDDHRIDKAIEAFLGRPAKLTSVPSGQPTMEETWPDGVDGLAPDAFIASTRITTDDPSETVSDIAMGLVAPPGTFFDVASLHLMTTATLHRLAELHPDGDFDVRRYRPNVVVDADDEGFVENEWVGKTVGLGPDDAATGMRVTLPTMRCIMTTLAQPTLGLDRDPSLLLTIARNNRIEIGGGQWACAGVYGDSIGAGTVKVGDPVSLR